jgi:hypothetical protein
MASNGKTNADKTLVVEELATENRGICFPGFLDWRFAPRGVTGILPNPDRVAQGATGHT